MRWSWLLFLGLVLGGINAGSAEERTTVQPKITRKALINPGMGWMHYHYSSRLWAYGGLQKPDDTLDWFPGCSTIYFRLAWCYLEPEEGKYR